MTIVDMLGQSGILTMFGMGVVFGFLILMVIVVGWMGKIISTLEAGKARQSGSAGEDAELGAVNAPVTAAIAAAVTEYRKNGS